MIQARRLGHVVLKVRDAGKSKDFYVQALGLKVAHEDLTRGTVFLSFGKEHHDLALFQLASGEPPAAEQPGGLIAPSPISSRQSRKTPITL